MGCRAQDARDREERERLASIPVSERYSWGMVAAIVASDMMAGAALWWTG